MPGTGCRQACVFFFSFKSGWMDLLWACQTSLQNKTLSQLLIFVELASWHLFNSYHSRLISALLTMSVIQFLLIFNTFFNALGRERERERRAHTHRQSYTAIPFLMNLFQNIDLNNQTPETIAYIPVVKMARSSLGNYTIWHNGKNNCNTDMSYWLSY